MRAPLLMVMSLLAACAPKPVLPPVDAGATLPASVAHAHNDYQHTHPLFDALDQNFHSVEADIYFNAGDLRVSHEGLIFKGTLKDLYLDPLAQRVADHGGFVFDDHQPFWLWIDLKDGSTQLQDALAALLEKYPFLTTFTDGQAPTPAAVTVVLTGNGAKVSLVDRPSPRPYIRDSNDYASTDPHADQKWAYYAIESLDFFSWDGHGAMPDGQLQQLHNLVNAAHVKERRLRVYDSPDTPEYWTLAKAAGLDFINADDLAGLRAVMDATP